MRRGLASSGEARKRAERLASCLMPGTLIQSPASCGSSAETARSEMRCLYVAF